MSNKIKNIKTHTLILRWYYQCKMFFFKYIKINEKSYKIFLFTTLNVWGGSKIWNTQKLIA